MDLTAVREDLGEVVADRQRLHAQSQVARDRHAVLADHGYAGSAVWSGVSDVEFIRWYGQFVLMEKGEAILRDVVVFGGLCEVADVK